MNAPPCPPGAALILLSDGEYALVDEEDYEELSALTWHHGDEGYVVHTVGIEGKTYLLLMHRVVLRAGPKELVDHWDGNRLDNRKHNLRSASHRQNAQNRATIAGRRWKGIYKAGDRWKARINFNGRMIHLGAYESEEIAALGKSVV